MKRPLIIEKPGLLGIPQRIFGVFFTTLWWVFFAWLWIPLLVKFELFAFLQPYTLPHIFTTEGFIILFKLIGFCVISALIISAILGTWSAYNLARFRKNRRKRPANLENDALAQHFHIGAARLVQWQRIKRMRVHHKDNGDLLRVETLGTGPLPYIEHSNKTVQDILISELTAHRDPNNPAARNSSDTRIG